MKRKILLIIVSLICWIGISTSIALEPPKVIDEGKRVKFQYVLTVNGKVIADTKEKGPLEYTHGDGRILEGLAVEMEGLRIGDKKTIIVPPERGYGSFDPSLLIKFPKEKLPEEMNPRLGAVMKAQRRDGGEDVGVVWEIQPETVTINFNHPLAGQELIFYISVIDIQ